MAAIEAAFANADLVTLTGSITPSLTRSGLGNGDISTVMSPRTVMTWADNYKMIDIPNGTVTIGDHTTPIQAFLDYHLGAMV